MIAVGYRKQPLQRVMNRNGQLCDNLLLRDSNDVADDARPSHPIDIRTALPV